MKKIIMEQFADFECIGAECPDTCCAGWSIFIDPESVEKYRKVEGDFGKKLQENMEEKRDGIIGFKMDHNGRCPFLNERDLCSIYLTLGPEYLCDTCQNYPRMIYLAGDVLFASLSISCPEVGRMILGEEGKTQYIFDEDEMVLETEPDWYSFNLWIRAYTTMHQILQEREFTVSGRMTALLVYAAHVHEMIEKKEETSDILQLFQQPELYGTIIRELTEGKTDIHSKLKFIRIFLRANQNAKLQPMMAAEFEKFYRFMSEQKEADPEIWIEAFQRFDTEVAETEKEQLLVYLLFRHFMEKYQKGSFWDSIEFICMFYMMYRCLTVLHYLCEGEFPDQKWRILMVARISRCFEHNIRFGETILSRMAEEGAAQLDFMLSLAV